MCINRYIICLQTDVNSYIIPSILRQLDGPVMYIHRDTQPYTDKG